jgi:hypothetical protein
MSSILNKIINLPNELVEKIKDYIPRKYIVFVNKENYLLYHDFVKTTIKNYENYIRDMVRRDNEFVFNMIIRENFKRWNEIKQYRYKNMIFKNYFYFIINYCIENDSANCRNNINDFLKEQGLGKNLHKKNVIKYIRI